ncbi:MAG: hypothetical protein ACFFD1_14970, partial [Candidatus Thorarchaeota archaeon]
MAELGLLLKGWVLSVIISFSGNDGSGKSTLIREFKTYLETHKNIEFEVREEFNYFLLKYGYKIFSQKNVGEIRNNYLSPKKSLKGYIIGLTWSYLVYLDLLIEFVYLNFYFRGSSKIVVLDRCIYDFYISWQYLGVSTKPMEYLIKIFPNYDLSFVLHTSAATAFSRKRKTHTYPLVFYKLQTDRYLKLKKEKNSLKYLNTSEKVDSSTRFINEKFLEEYYKKYECDKNNMGLFLDFVKLKAASLKKLLSD